MIDATEGGPPKISVQPLPARPFESSEKLDLIFQALCKAQGQMETASKGSKAHNYKYADLASCWETIRKPLFDNDLMISQLPKANSDKVSVVSLLGHKSGQWISNHIEMTPMKRDPQGFGSALTYARRYGLMALVGIAPEEDDGKAASTGGQTQEPPPKNQKREPAKKQPPKEQPPKKVSQAQITRLFSIAGERGWIKEEIDAVVNDMLGLKSSKDLTKKTYFPSP